MSANIPKHSDLPAQYGPVEISAIATVPSITTAKQPKTALPAAPPIGRLRLSIAEKECRRRKALRERRPYLFN
jgi:hypothetical protein